MLGGKVLHAPHNTCPAALNSVWCSQATNVLSIPSARAWPKCHSSLGKLCPRRPWNIHTQFSSIGKYAWKVRCIPGLLSRLGIPIFGSDFWDPHWKRNSNSVFDSENSGRIFFQIPLLKNQEIGIPIPKFGIPKKIKVGIQYTSSRGWCQLW